MSRRCAVTGKGVQAGNNVSHSMRKTRRRWLPNIQTSSVLSDSLGESFRIKLSTHGLRTLEHCGGLDAFLMRKKPDELPADLRRIRKRVAAKRRAEADAAGAAAKS